MSADTQSIPEFYAAWNRLAGRYFRWQAQQFRPYLGRRVADLGCGPGNLASSLLGRELYLAVDSNQAMLDAVRAAHGHRAELVTLRADATAPDLSERLAAHGVDTVVCANLLEHLEHDRDVVARMLAALPDGGCVCLLVPAMPWAFGSLDALDGHLRRYTRAMVRERLVDGLPCRLEMLRYFNALGCLGWWWKGRVKRQATHDDGSYRAMNAIVPLVSRLERLVPPPFGLSVVAALRKV